MNMPRHFEQELQSLKTTLIKMGSLAEDAIRSALRALLENDAALAAKVIDGDERINSLEIEIDNAIIDLLALQQPVATDLRMILAAQKINNDLERIGDHAVNIAESAASLIERRVDEPYFDDVPKMGELARHMLRDALDAFIHNDANLGQSILAHDDEIDDLNRKTVRAFIDRMKTNTNSIERGMDLIRISRNLERVADLATNIAEEVIFLTQARIVKHNVEGKK